MINIIAHSGFWIEPSEKNTEIAFERALSEGFGIETDLRDHDGKLVVSHDMPNSESLSFEVFLDICNKYSFNLTLALNIKSDGLQDSLKNVKINNSHFYFDMSVPDMLGYISRNMMLYSRYSEIELSPPIYDKCDGIWLDNFADDKLDIEALERFLSDNKQVVLVSPELHKREHLHYWKNLKKFLNDNPNWSKDVGLCTDFPSKAREYFDVQ